MCARTYLFGDMTTYIDTSRDLDSGTVPLRTERRDRKLLYFLRESWGIGNEGKAWGGFVIDDLDQLTLQKHHSTIPLDGRMQPPIFRLWKGEFCEIRSVHVKMMQLKLPGID
jgi:hypothetical protein